MSRTGPAYVETDEELRADIDRKQHNGEITKETADAFLDLYAFAQELGDRVTIGGAKNANFQMKVDAHQGNYPNDPGVFSANVNGELRIWPARMVFDNAEDPDVAWTMDDYEEFERRFNTLSGVDRGTTHVDFDAIGSTIDREELESMIAAFVATCREKAEARDSGT